MFNKKQIAFRKRLFESYKEAANRYYDELALEDKNNADAYNRKKVSSTYKL
jgi:hypothetical protein